MKPEDIEIGGWYWIEEKPNLGNSTRAFIRVKRVERNYISYQHKVCGDIVWKNDDDVEFDRDSYIYCALERLEKKNVEELGGWFDDYILWRML